MQLTKVNPIGTIYYQFFKMKDGSVTRVECTKEESTAQLKVDGGTWIAATSGTLFDTVSGDLEDGSYVENEKDISVKFPGQIIRTFTKDQVKDGIIDDAFLKDGEVEASNKKDVTVRLKK